MKLAGMIFIVTSAGSVGLRIAQLLKKRCKLLRQLLSALHILKNEIGFCGTPLPQAFALVAVGSNGLVERLFSHMAKEMDRRRWLTPLAALQQAWEQEPELSQEHGLRDALMTLTSGLGKYDRDSQIQAIERTSERLETLLSEAEQERSLRGKAYEALSICAGLAMAVLLL